MEKIKVLIVEDKLLVAENIASILKKHLLEIAGICDSGEEAIHLVEYKRPDLILMDIELAGALDGISTAKLILDKHLIPVIYLSDYTDQNTVDRAKKTTPANYLSKPFQEMDLIRAIDIAFYNANTAHQIQNKSLLNEHVFLRTDNQSYVKLSYESILYLEADRAYCNIVTEEKNFKMSISMNHIHEQLNNKQFVKVHRSHVINASKISALEGNMIHIGKHKVQMSKEFKECLMDRLKIIK
jgi:DNA-binding LytR/AlgR family response regulator